MVFTDRDTREQTEHDVEIVFRVHGASQASGLAKGKFSTAHRLKLHMEEVRYGQSCVRCIALRLGL